MALNDSWMPSSNNYDTNEVDLIPTHCGKNKEIKDSTDKSFPCHSTNPPVITVPSSSFKMIV